MMFWKPIHVKYEELRFVSAIKKEARYDVEAFL